MNKKGGVHTSEYFILSLLPVPIDPSLPPPDARGWGAPPLARRRPSPPHPRCPVRHHPPRLHPRRQPCSAPLVTGSSGDQVVELTYASSPATPSRRWPSSALACGSRKRGSAA
ncbi:hypothetical protein SETIT_3G232300v2 [Setaria italica]|uniref:Uncharacterized protein n=1 Tax=Setaria italica TaxID=4555 RepID=A0A368QJX9_SETIT|nr:hypothetical protein SETIT_3G232300v2 [Setaria italica]